MVSYKVHLKFKEDGKSLNEVIIDALKIALEKQVYTSFNLSNKSVSCKHIPDSLSERNTNS